ncbi:helix-turn-helix transcriptional regulator [Nocardiopsis sp. NPDC006198]|uniref:helix-turn-helix domain-containing protein n=1 Tax=Nocardiopsis sp. NPDC006198 TaxID=3154472 RepID=UPI0033B95560
MAEKITPARKKFGRELVRFRKAARLTQAEAADALGVVPTAVSSYERGTRGIELVAVATLDELYGANQSLIRKWHEANQETGLDPWFQQLSDLEEAAVELRDYQPLVFPGLVQTEKYARALTRDVWPGRGADSVESLVRSRMRRQKIFGQTDAPFILMIIEEPVVYRRVGALSRDDHVAQIRRLIHEIERDTLRLQIIPRGAPRHHGGTGPFRINSFSDRPAVASAEHMTGEAVIDDAKLVQHCMTVFGLLQGEALSGAQSLDMLKEALEDV